MKKSVIYSLLVISSLSIINKGFGQEKINNHTEDSLQEITHLDFYNMNIEVLPEWVFKCKNLQEINLTGNERISLDSVISQLSIFQQLRKLNLSSCSIKDLPPSICKISRLTYLDIRNNFLKSIPNSIKYCNDITGIALDGNSIDENSLKYLLTSLPKLNWLSIAKNKLKILPQELCIPPLKYLDIYGNDIESLPECFYKSATVKQILIEGSVMDAPTLKSKLDKKVIQEKFSNNGRHVIVN